MEKILIVEDDVNINNLINEALRKKNYECTQAFSGSEALLAIKMSEFDLMILDLMLPGANGEDVLRQIRSTNNIPVIVVSAKDELDTKVDVLAMGADDYITKPFEIKELEARVAVCLRRSRFNDSDLNQGKQNQSLKQLEDSDENSNFNKANSEKIQEDIITYKELTIHKRNYEVRIGENRLPLTRQEFRILELLLSYPGKVFTKQEIYDYAWEEYYVGVDKTINVHISNIRGKLKKYTDKEYIETVWGIGFKMNS